MNLEKKIGLSEEEAINRYREDIKNIPTVYLEMVANHNLHSFEDEIHLTIGSRINLFKERYETLKYAWFNPVNIYVNLPCVIHFWIVKVKLANGIDSYWNMIQDITQDELQSRAAE